MKRLVLLATILPATILLATILLATILLATIFAALNAMAQQAPVNSPLLDHLAGKWLLQGTVGKRPVTHDLDAEWVLQHQYLRFHEVSQGKNDKGKPDYEATVFIGWNEKIGQYGC